MAKINGFDKHFKPGAQDECWLWPGSVTQEGYGMAYVSGKRVAAHRLAYERLVGPIPAGLQLDHLCRARSCVNPGHLEPVTSKENVLRGIGHTAINAKKTHCVNGHQLSGENLRIGRTGWRACKECQRDNCRKFRKTSALHGVTSEQIEAFRLEHRVITEPPEPEWVTEENRVLDAICDAALALK